MTAGRFARIAVAIDGSPTAQEALEVAIELAKAEGSELLVIAVAPVPPVFVAPNAPFVPTTMPVSTVPRYRELVEAAVRRAQEAGVASVSGVSDEGTVVEAILAQVNQQRSDLLVVGSRGLSTAQRLLLGSVSTALVNHAPCPVLVVRPPTPPRERR